MSQKQGNWCAWVVSVPTLACLAMGLCIELQAQNPDSADCGFSIGPTRQLNGKTIGPNTCTIVGADSIQNASGAPYQRIEVMIGGCIDGYTAKTGPEPYPELMQFTDHPEFSLAQRRNWGPYYHGISCYPAQAGKNGMTIFLPESAADWNGKLYMVFHGGSPYVPVKKLLPRQPNRYNILMGHNQYVALMVDKGYAVGYTHRSASKGRMGDQQVVLDDGSVLEGRDYQYHIGLLRSWTKMAKNFVQARLGRGPSRTYWYGRSGGSAPGRILKYVPGANRHADGQRVFDGLLLDDAAGGWFWPTMYYTRNDIKEGVFSLTPDKVDHLVYDDAFKEAFVPQIDIAHLGYVGNMFVEGNYQFIKRENARHLVRKGLADKARTYEIRGVSHGDAGAVYPDERWKQNMDLSGFFDELIGVLDRWVEDGIEPPPTRSDSMNLGDVDGDGYNENPAIRFPEIACPTGVYYLFPEGVRGVGSTGFTPFLTEPRRALNADTTPIPPGFDESWLEPLDNRGYPVDMNGNGVRDTRESITQAWQRRAREGKKYGVLEPGETLTPERYASCVAQVARELYDQKLLSKTAMAHYVEVSKAGPEKLD